MRTCTSKVDLCNMGGSVCMGGLVTICYFIMRPCKQSIIMSGQRYYH